MRPSPGHLACSDKLAIRSSKVCSKRGPHLPVPNSVVKLSAASRKAVVSMALSWLAFTGTSTKDFLRVSNQVPPGGYVVFVAIDAVVFGYAACTGFGEQRWG